MEQDDAGENRMRIQRPGRVAALLALGLLLGLGAGPVRAQGAAEARLERIRAELPDAAVERIEASLQQAREQGLPVEPLLDKAVEGIAKRVPGARIADAVHQLTADLGRARTLLADGEPRPADVAAVADGLRRGVPEDAIRRIARGAGPEEPLGLVVHTVGDLMDHGVPPGHALAAMEAWRARGANLEELRQLPAAVGRLIRQGALPEQAAAAVTGAMRQGGPPGLNDPPGLRGQGGNRPTGPPIPPGTGPPDDRGKGKDKGKGKPPGGGSSGG
jgi:hypothetical protein